MSNIEKQGLLSHKIGRTNTLAAACLAMAGLVLTFVYRIIA
jgi:hypothetical protein